jgi:hypothetical protein
MMDVEVIIERRVKKCGVLSPQLFNYYINGLLEIIKDTGMGIRHTN